MNKLKDIGIAEGLDFFSLTYDSIREPLLKVLEHPKYVAKAKQLQKKFQDQKELPLERAIWWLEWVLRNPDCENMKSPVLQLGFIVGNSFDIIAFVTIILIGLIFVSFKTLKLIFVKITKYNVVPIKGVKSKIN